ncbi:hypothetical protein [Chloroflexus sp.]
MCSRRGWYHHLTLMMIAHLFLVSVHQALTEDAPAVTVSRARLLLQAVLAKTVNDVEADVQAVRQIQRRT